MDKLLISTAGYISGFLFSVLAFGKTEGDQGPIPNIFFKLAGFTIHPHHWSFFLVALVLLLILQIKFKFLPEMIYYFLISFLFGGINQGLLFKDWFEIVK